MTQEVHKYSLLGLARLVLASPGGFVATMVLFTVVGFGIDRRITDIRLQDLLGLVTALLLALSLPWFTSIERVQALTVVVVATFFEVIGSVIWGVYRYRLGNLPLFVPTGHGLVYLTGLRISQFPLIRANPKTFVRIAVGFATVWAVVGLTGAFGRVDVAGAVGVGVLCLAMLRGRTPTVYAGVFFFVAFLEFYGTSVGTWRWAADVPGLGVPDGNPPSGAASGYVVFDVCAVFAAPWLLICVRNAKDALGRRLSFARTLGRLAGGATDDIGRRTRSVDGDQTHAVARLSARHYRGSAVTLQAERGGSGRRRHRDRGDRAGPQGDRGRSPR
jgi:hypothetical protein